MPRIHLVIIGVITLLTGFGCSAAPDPFAGAAPGQLRILTSFPPLYCFAANVTGDQAKVLCFLSSQGPHGFHATALDSIKVTSADLFIVNGLGLDDFATKLVSDAQARRAWSSRSARRSPMPS